MKSVKKDSDIFLPTHLLRREVKVLLDILEVCKKEGIPPISILREHGMNFQHIPMPEGSSGRICYDMHFPACCCFISYRVNSLHRISFYPKNSLENFVNYTFTSEGLLAETDRNTTIYYKREPSQAGFFTAVRVTQRVPVTIIAPAA